MIIKVTQVKASLKNEFTIEIDKDLKYYANSSELKGIKQLYMTDTQGREVFYIDNRQTLNNPLFSYENRDVKSSIAEILDDSSEVVGKYYCESGRTFSIEYNGEVIRGEYKNENYNTCISLYNNDIQVAEIVKSKAAFDNLDEYYIFILDQYNFLDKILSFFIIYYDYCYYKTLKYGNSGVSLNLGNSVELEVNTKSSIGNLKWIKENFDFKEYINISTKSKIQYKKAQAEIKGNLIFLMIACIFMFATMLLINILSK